MALRCAALLFLIAGAAGHLRAEGQHTALVAASREQPATGAFSQATYAEQIARYSYAEQIARYLLDRAEFAFPGLASLRQRLDAGSARQPPTPPPEVEQQVEHPVNGPVPFMIQFMNVVIQVVISLIFAKVYISFRSVPQGMYDPEAAEEYDGDWKHHCCSWYEEPGTCLCGFCCFPVRWSETMSLVKDLISFWPALACFMILAFFRITALFPIAYVGMLIVCVSYRQKLRRRFTFRQQGGITYVTDFLMYLCCGCCAIIQEARHVEDALARQHKETSCPEGRPRSDQRAACWTCRPFTSDGPSYTK